MILKTAKFKIKTKTNDKSFQVQIHILQVVIYTIIRAILFGPEKIIFSKILTLF